MTDNHPHHSAKGFAMQNPSLIASPAGGGGRGKIPMGLLIIGIMKLMVALLLVAASLGAFKLMNKDVEETFQQMIVLLHLDPKNHFLNAILEKISGVDDKQLKELGVATMIYAALYVTEGIGLLMGKHWAEYLVVIITGSLLPLECYEVIEKISALRVGVLVVNLAVLLYLVYRIRRDRRRARVKIQAEQSPP